MPFVKLDCGILNSSLWVERESRDLFITSLLMAEPFELTASVPQLHVRSLNETGWTVPPGWYGFVAAAGPGIASMAGVPKEAGLTALESLGSPDPWSRSKDHEGRRVVRIDGGFLVLNYMRYRDKDHGSAERSKRYRERQMAIRHGRERDATRETVTQRRDITQAEADLEAEADLDQDLARTEDRDLVKDLPQPCVTRARDENFQAQANGNPHHNPANLINGAEQRRHGQHAWCDQERGLCVPYGLHEQFKKNGLKTDDDLKAWYPTIVTSVNGKAVGDLFAFWRVSFDNWVGTPVKKAATGYMSKGDRIKHAVAEVRARHGKRAH